MRLLFVASTPMEYGGMRKLTKARKSPGGARLWVRSGRISGHEILMAANGVGSGRATAAVDALHAVFHPDAVVSTGFSGALDPRLQIADVVLGTCVTSSGRSYAALPVRCSKPHVTGVVVSMDHVVQTAAEKRTLRAQGGSIVEMEAAGVASRAEALGLAVRRTARVYDSAVCLCLAPAGAVVQPAGGTAA